MSNEHLKIEKGHFYRRRDGVKCECVATDLNGRSNDRIGFLSCENNRSFFSTTEDGYWWDDKEESSKDITSFWTDKPTYNWPAMPAWANWATIDENGEVWWWETKPEKSSDAWINRPFKGGIIPIQYAPTNYTGDWKDSLVERPK